MDKRDGQFVDLNPVVETQESPKKLFYPTLLRDFSL